LFCILIQKKKNFTHPPQHPPPPPPPQQLPLKNSYIPESVQVNPAAAPPPFH
jgi:hypothetical protein